MNELMRHLIIFIFNDTATTEIYTYGHFPDTTPFRARDGRGNARRKDREANPEAPARRCAEGRRSSVERACDCSGRHGRDGLDRPGWPGDHGGDGAHADPRDRKSVV